MATSLKDIPGANRARKPRRSERGLWAPSRSTKLDLTPGSLRLSRPKQRGPGRSGRQIDVFLVVLVLGAIGAHVYWISLAVKLRGLLPGAGVANDGAAGPTPAHSV